MTGIHATYTFSWPAVSHIWYLYTTMSNIIDFVKNAALQQQNKYKYEQEIFSKADKPAR